MIPSIIRLWFFPTPRVDLLLDSISGMPFPNYTRDEMQYESFPRNPCEIALQYEQRDYAM
jgi:hypothetical protein